MATSSQLVVTPFGVGQSSLTFQNVSLDSYNCEPVLANDQAAVEGVRYTISGSALVTGVNWQGLQTALEQNASRLASASMTYAGSSLVSLTSGTSSIGGPFLKITGTQVIGTGIALVRFDLNDVSTMCDTPVVSHTWTQRFAIDARGRMTRSVNGILTTARNATASDNQPAIRGSSAWDATKPWADLFRRAVMPDVPGKYWRRTQQEFAYDITSRQLVYAFTDEQFAHDLPDGCRVGDMNFTYERSAENAGIGICRMTVELEGDMNLKGVGGTTGNRKLIDAAIQLSKQRINANFASVIITRMAVTEQNILSGFSIRLELEAQCFPTSSNAANTFAPIAYMVGNNFNITRTEARAPDAYGSFVPPSENTPAVSYYMVPHFISNLVNGMNCDHETVGLPYASIVEISAANTYGNVTVAVANTLEGVSGMNSSVSAGKYAADQKQPGDEGGFTQIVAHDVALTRVGVDTGMVRVPTMYSTYNDYVYQIHKPRVIVTERIEVSRANTAPSRILRPKPPSCIVLSEDWNVAFGKFDMQGQRLFTGIYERKLELFIQTFDAGGGGDPPAPADPDWNGFYIIPYNASTNQAGDVVAWKAMNGFVLPTLSNLATDVSQASNTHVFGTLPTAAAQYPVAPEGYING